MKKLLIAIGSIIILCSAAKYWGDLLVNGSIVKSDPTFTGTLTISNSGNNTYSFAGDGPGTFMIAGPGNATDFGSQRLTALVRGATFSSTTTGVHALDVVQGIAALNQSNGRTIIGPNVGDDLSSQLQVKGVIKSDSFKVAGGSTGYVLTQGVSGYFTPQPNTGGTTYGTWTPTLTSSGGSLTALTVNHAYYWVTGNQVHCQVDIGFNIGATGALTYVYFTLPYSASPLNSVSGFGGLFQSGQQGYAAYAAPYSFTQGSISFLPTAAVSAGASFEFTYTK